MLRQEHLAPAGGLPRSDTQGAPIKVRGQRKKNARRAEIEHQELEHHKMCSSGKATDS